MAWQEDEYELNVVNGQMYGKTVDIVLDQHNRPGSLKTNSGTSFFHKVRKEGDSYICFTAQEEGYIINNNNDEWEVFVLEAIEA